MVGFTIFFLLPFLLDKQNYDAWKTTHSIKIIPWAEDNWKWQVVIVYLWDMPVKFWET